MRTWFGFRSADRSTSQTAAAGLSSALAPPVPLDEASFVVLDLEMTGLDARRDSIVALGAVKMTGGRIEIGKTFSSLVKPRTRVSAASVRVHQLLPTELEQKDEADGVVRRFWEFCGGATLVGYCLDVDLPFLEAEAKRLGLPLPNGRRIDVLHLFHAVRDSHASTLLEDLPPRNVSLYDIAQALGIGVRGAHDALADACITAQVFQRFLWMLRAARNGSLDLDNLIKTGNRLARGRNQEIREMGYTF